MPKPSRPNAPPPSDQADAAIKVVHYIDKNGHDYYFEWWSDLRDDKAKKAIYRRIARLENGNFGLCGPLRDGVWELKIDAGPGYRVYYAKTGLTVVLLLCGGDKRKQNSDIDLACAYWNDWKQREGEQ